MTWAVTLDFHNTIAMCDQWFQLEVYDLIPAYLAWREQTLNVVTSDDVIAAGRKRYRELRQGVMDSGVELDAAAGIASVLETLEIDVDDDAIARALEDIFRPTLAGTSPLPGIVDSVKALDDAGVRLIVISSAAFHPFLEWTLEDFGIADRFEAILTSASTGHYKSTPRIYEAALAMLDLPAERCIHVGDSERFDVRPAAELGFGTVLFTHDPEVDCTASTADLCIDSLEDLPAKLNARFGLPLAI